MYVFQVFSLARIGCNLAISDIWIDLSECMRSTTTRKAPDSKRVLVRVVLCIGVGFFLASEFALGVTCLVGFQRVCFNYGTRIPAVLFVVELSVGFFFLFSSLQMLSLLNKSVRGGKRHAGVKRASRLIFASGISSLINVAIFGLLAVKVHEITATPYSYLVTFAPVLYSRLLDAGVQVLICKPSAVQLVSLPRLLKRIPVLLRTGFSSKISVSLRIGFSSKSAAGAVTPMSERAPVKITQEGKETSQTSIWQTAYE